MAWTWTLPENFPPGKYLRVKVDGGTLTQGAAALPWVTHGYYEVALDAGRRPGLAVGVPRRGRGPSAPALGRPNEVGPWPFGGGALLRGLPQILSKMLGVPVRVAPDPLTAVVRGAGIVTENPEPYVDFFIDEEDILSEA